MLPPLEKVTTTELFCSAATVITPVAAVASEAVAPLATPVPRARTGAAWRLVSSVKKVVPADEALPAASVAIALTPIVPSPSTARSSVLSKTGTGVLPSPVMVLVIVLLPLEKVTSTVLPNSAETVITPVVAIASSAVAPLTISVPSSRSGLAGGMVSRVKDVPSVGEILPAASVAIAFTVIVPSPSVARSSEVSTTGTSVLPLPVRNLVTALLPFENVSTTVTPVSAVKVTTPVSAIASAAVAPLAISAPRPS